MTDGYGADVYLEGTGHPSAVLQGLNLLRKLGTYVEYGVFGIGRHRRLEHHQRRQGARRPRRPPRPALLARGDPHARVRSAADGSDLHPPAAAGELPEGPRPGRQRQLVDQGVADPRLSGLDVVRGLITRVWSTRRRSPVSTRSRRARMSVLEAPTRSSTAPGSTWRRPAAPGVRRQVGVQVDEHACASPPGARSTRARGEQLLDRAGHLGDRVVQVHLDDLGGRRRRRRCGASPRARSAPSVGHVGGRASARRPASVAGA